MFQRHNAMGNIELIVTARGWIDYNHDRYSLQILIADQSRSFVRVIRVKLDQIGSFAKFSLHLVLKLVSKVLVIGIVPVGSFGH